MEGVLGQLGGFDPMTQGLLSAAFRGLQMSGPSVGKPVSFGQVLGGAGEAGMNSYSQANKTQMDEAYRRRLMELEQVKTDMAKQQLLQAQRKDQMLIGLLGGGPTGGAAPGGVQGAPQAPGASPAGPGGFLNNPLQALAAQNLGIGGAVDVFKHLDTPQKFEGGSTYRDRRTGVDQFMPKVDVGMTPTANGGIGVAPGALATIGALEGAKEGAKAGFDPYVLQPTTPGASPTVTTRAAVTSAARDAAAPRPAPAPAPTRVPNDILRSNDAAYARATADGVPSPDQPIVPFGNSTQVPPGPSPAPSGRKPGLMDPTENLTQALAQTVTEYAQNPASRAELKTGYDRLVKELNRRGVKVNVPLPDVSAVPGVPSGMSADTANVAKAEGAAQESKFKNDAERVSALEQKLPSLFSTARRIDKLEALTKDDKTYAAAGAELKTQLGSISQAFGLKVNQAKTANSEEYLAHIAELMKDRLASKDYGSGTGVSNLDLLAASKPLPELAKTSQGRQQIITALRADTQKAIKDSQSASDYFAEKNSLRGFRYPSEQVTTENTGGIPKSPASKGDKIKFLGFDNAGR